jgi:transcriptional regulator with XRE-family HTH domain
MSHVEIGPKIRELRKVAEMTQIELAEAAGLGLRTILKIESGESSPSVDTLISLMGALKQPMSTLFPDSDSPHADIIEALATADEHEIEAVRAVLNIRRRAKATSSKAP